VQPDLIPFRAWCKANNIGITTAYKLLNVGSLNAVKVGKKTFIHREEATRWINTLPAYKKRFKELPHF